MCVYVCVIVFVCVYVCMYVCNLLLSSLQVVDSDLVQVPRPLVFLAGVVVPDSQEGERTESLVNRHYVGEDGVTWDVLGNRGGR